MRQPPTVKSATLLNSSDLTVIAPIRKGFVPSLDAVTYKTRVKRVLQSLHLGRTAALEFDFIRAISDVAERIGRIQSVRIALLEPEDKVMLAVTFDGSLESYVRAIWQKAACSLDLIFCNTEGYVTGWDHSFEEWDRWLRASQAEAPFLYSIPGLTFHDAQFLRTFEWRMRRPGERGIADLEAGRIRVARAEEVADRIRRRGMNPMNLGSETPLNLQEASRATFEQGLRGLAALYRLADVHLPGTPDGRILHRAAVEILREFVQMVSSDASDEYAAAIEFAQFRFKDALAWLRSTPDDRPLPALPRSPDPDLLADVQGGILEAYPEVRDGCLLLLSFDSQSAMADFLSGVRITSAVDLLPSGGIAVNLAVTLEGMRFAGLTDDDITELPADFVQGMERRAGLLGDVRANHPRRWRLPPLNGSLGVEAREIAEDDPSPRVNLNTVHALLQLRRAGTNATTSEARAALWERFRAISTGCDGVRLLSVQWMYSLRTPGGDEKEHFGYLHTDFAPILSAASRGKKYGNQVHIGEALIGEATSADFASPPEGSSWTHSLLRHGTFSVFRKLLQDIDGFGAAVERGVDQLIEQGIQKSPGTGRREDVRQLLMAKMMGRWPAGIEGKSGRPLANHAEGNVDDFSYLSDQEGSLCPLHAHVRLANPREVTGAYFSPPAPRAPRLFRRGMSYGPAAQAASSSPASSHRGLMFIAHNSSIGEQFEVIQGWLTGGNGSGTYSGASDVFMGVPEPGRPRAFQFEHEAKVYRVQIDETDRLDDQPEPFVRLEWGLYSFTPSLSALKRLAERAKTTARCFVKSWSAEKGLRELRRLIALEGEGPAAAVAGWKALLEESTSAVEFTAASVLAAIRDHHGGVLRTPFGVLVASRVLVDQVLHDAGGQLSVAGYMPRLERSLGPNFLGMDPRQGGLYERESGPANSAVMALASSVELSHEVQRASAAEVARVITELQRHAASEALENGTRHWDQTFDLREVVDPLLAHFCETWFGLSEQGGHFARNGLKLTWNQHEPPCYPGHLMAPSRYTFWPHPGPAVERIGAEHGLAIRRALTAYLGEFGPSLTAPLARAILDSELGKSDLDYAARTMAGLMMGFLPTVDANMRRVADEWWREGTLWTLRNRAASGEATEVIAREIRREFVRAMQLRAAPDLLWRIAVTGHSIGDGPHAVKVCPGDVVVASLISASQECMQDGDPTLEHAFGGRRSRAGAHPPHACPGYGPAMAVMLGFFAGLVEYPGPLRPGPAPLTFSMRGLVDQGPEATHLRHKP